MEFIRTEGKTIFHCKAGRMEVPISVLSKRAARLVIEMSEAGKWWKPVILYATPWTINNSFRIVAFQPDTGFHLAVREI